MNKLKLFFVLVLMLLGVGYKADANDINAPIMKEVYYNMMERQLRKEVEQAFVKNGISPIDAELNMTYLKTQIDMLAIKKRVMSCFDEHNIGFMQSEDKTAEIADCFAEYRAQLVLYNEISGKAKRLEDRLAVAAYFMPASEEVKGNDNEKLLAIIKNVGANLAISRMDVKELHKKMLQCVDEKGVKAENRTTKIMECSDEGRVVFRKEMLQAMDELMAYVTFFAQMMLRAEGRIR